MHRVLGGWAGGRGRSASCLLLLRHGRKEIGQLRGSAQESCPEGELRVATATRTTVLLVVAAVTRPAPLLTT